MTLHTLYEQNTIEEMRHALDIAHESLKWLGRVRAYVDTITMATGPTLAELVELFTIAELCAELHAAKDPITVDDVIELAGWDTPEGRRAVERALAKLESLEMLKGCRLVVS